MSIIFIPIEGVAALEIKCISMMAANGYIGNSKVPRL